jgi:hypothetical protein
MGWVIAWILLFAIYALFMLYLASLSAAMGGAQTGVWSSLLCVWLIMLTVPAWGPIVWPINRLGYRVPVLGAPFPLGSRKRRGG